MTGPIVLKSKKISCAPNRINRHWPADVAVEIFFNVLIAMFDILRKLQHMRLPYPAGFKEKFGLVINLNSSYNTSICHGSQRLYVDMASAFMPYFKVLASRCICLLMYNYFEQDTVDFIALFHSLYNHRLILTYSNHVIFK